MKKLVLAAAATALIGFGHAPVSAQTEPIPDDLQVECGEADVVTENCQEFYVEALPPTTSAPATTTTSTVAVSPPGEIPKTGSGVSSILGVGATLLVGGGIVVVATRRRSTAPAH